MSVNAEAVKALRLRTGVGVMDCKRALEEAGGDLEAAEDVLRHRGLALAQKKAGRQTSQGLMEAYIHPGGRLGVLVEVNCETDFVARTPDFQALAHDLAMQVAAMAPSAIQPEDLPPESDLDPQQACLMLQPFIKDPSRKISQVVAEVIAKVGENIQVRRFARFELGESGGAAQV